MALRILLAEDYPCLRMLILKRVVQRKLPNMFYNCNIWPGGTLRTDPNQTWRERGSLRIFPFLWNYAIIEGQNTK